MTTALKFSKLSDLASINPKLTSRPIDEELISFVPMSAVDADTGATERVEERTFGEVSKGYTVFSDKDVLVAKITPCFENGKIAQAGLKHRIGVGSTEFHVIRPNRSQLDERYLLHFLRTPAIRVAGERRMTGSAGQRRVPEAFLASLSIPTPPLPDQKRIAAVLDRVDELRAKRREALAHLDDLIQSIFLDMFGDPVSNPKEWPLGTVGEHLTFQQYGPRFYNESYSQDGMPIARITDLNSMGDLDFGSMPKMDVTEDVRRKFALRPGELIFARTGATVGKLALIREGDPECIAGAYFIRMRFDNDILPEYAAALLRTESVQAIVWAGSHQSAQQNFSGPGLRALPLPIPPIGAQQGFTRKAAAVTALKELHQASLVDLDALFASLQDRAFRGLL